MDMTKGTNTERREAEMADAGTIRKTTLGDYGVGKAAEKVTEVSPFGVYPDNCQVMTGVADSLWDCSCRECRQLQREAN